MLSVLTYRLYNSFDGKKRQRPLFRTKITTEDSHQNRNHQNVEAGRGNDIHSMNNWHSSSHAYFDTHMSSHDMHTTSDFDSDCGGMSGCDTGGS